MKNRLSQRQGVFAIMLENGVVRPHQLVGTTVEVSNKSVFLSYKAPSRLTEIYQDLFHFIERFKLDNKNYYVYKFNKLEFLKAIKENPYSVPKEYVEVAYLFGYIDSNAYEK